MSASWFDHAIASVAPRMAARRVMARQAFETLTRGYDGAARGRRTDGWRAPGSSADTEIGVAGALLRDRMRDLVRNNPHAAKAVAVLVNNIIGAGIMPRAASGDDKLDRKVDALFERWTAECDADGQLDFYGLQTLICREMVEAGEVLVRRRLRRASDGLPVPLQLQVLEADFLDATNPAPSARGGWCRGSSSTRSASAGPTGCMPSIRATPTGLAERPAEPPGPGDRDRPCLREAAHAGARRSLGRAGDPQLARSRRLRGGGTGPQEDRGLRHRHRVRRRRGPAGHRALGGRCRRQPGGAVRTGADRLCARRQGHPLQPALGHRRLRRIQAGQPAHDLGRVPGALRAADRGPSPR